MSSTHSTRIRIPESALLELEEVESWDWSEGIGLENLIGWINQVAARFRPAEIDESARASQEFSTRTFRHYQTLGCIDPPQRVGRKASYSFRHYLQGLLLRKLLWERVPSTQMVAVMRGRTVAEYKNLLFEGIEIVPSLSRDQTGAASSAESTAWARHGVGPGIELHLRSDRPPLNEEEVKNVLESVRIALAATFPLEGKGSSLICVER